ncbi:hypothetical protein DWB63_13475 [Pseudodesulfovibrio sp. S3]|nr:hypothetical protein DWB63_13475 [Pseudodesulfovibrio sp. S3]
MFFHDVQSDWTGCSPSDIHILAEKSGYEKLPLFVRIASKIRAGPKFFWHEKCWVSSGFQILFIKEVN